jgi:trehalose/maltose hydrolase-like predicted phosphorylase
VVLPERQRVATDYPHKRSESANEKARHEGIEGVLSPYHTAIKKTERGRHEKNKRRAHEDKCAIASVDAHLCASFTRNRVVQKK